MHYEWTWVNRKRKSTHVIDLCLVVTLNDKRRYNAWLIINKKNDLVNQCKSDWNALGKSEMQKGNIIGNQYHFT